VSVKGASKATVRTEMISITIYYKKSIINQMILKFKQQKPA